MVQRPHKERNKTYTSNYIRIELHVGSIQSRLQLISNDRQNIDQVLAMLLTHQKLILSIKPSRWNWLINMYGIRVYKYTVDLNQQANGFAFAQWLIDRL